MDQEMSLEERMGNTGGPLTPKEHKRQRGRSCKVTHKEWDGEKANEIVSSGTFHCWGLRQNKPADTKPKITGSETVALVEFEDGRMRMVRPDKIQFTDRNTKKEVKEDWGLDSMDIQSPPGTIIKFVGNGGSTAEQEDAKKHLKVGATYEIEKIEIGNWRTDVWLEGFPGVAFNSVMFENVRQ